MCWIVVVVGFMMEEQVWFTGGDGDFRQNFIEKSQTLFLYQNCSSPLFLCVFSLFHLFFSPNFSSLRSTGSLSLLYLFSIFFYLVISLSSLSFICFSLSLDLYIPLSFFSLNIYPPPPHYICVSIQGCVYCSLPNFVMDLYSKRRDKNVNWGDMWAGWLGGQE